MITGTWSDSDISSSDEDEKDERKEIEGATLVCLIAMDGVKDDKSIKEVVIG